MPHLEDRLYESPHLALGELKNMRSMDWVSRHARYALLERMRPLTAHRIQLMMGPDELLDGLNAPPRVHGYDPQRPTIPLPIREFWDRVLYHNMEEQLRNATWWWPVDNRQLTLHDAFGWRFRRSAAAADVSGSNADGRSVRPRLG